MHALAGVVLIPHGDVAGAAAPWPIAAYSCTAVPCPTSWLATALAYTGSHCGSTPESPPPSAPPPALPTASPLASHTAPPLALPLACPSTWQTKDLQRTALNSMQSDNAGTGPIIEHCPIIVIVEITKKHHALQSSTEVTPKVARFGLSRSRLSHG